MRENKKTDKIIAIYHAIEDLVGEGADITSMHVSAIAAKAGIGKGTTYEYFSSKEEMVVKAMIYLVGSMVKRILHQMEQMNDFHDKFIMLFDEMESKVKQRACILKYFDMLHDMNICQLMHDTLLVNAEANEANPMRVIHYLVAEGQKEGLISTKYSMEYMEMALFSRLLAFSMYLDSDNPKDCTSDEVKEMMYQGVCREFGVWISLEIMP